MLKHLLLCFIAFSAINAQVIEDVLCEGRVFTPVCASGNIRIVAASFGVTDGQFCGGKDNTAWTVNCAVDVAENLRNLCGGRPTCSVPVEGRNACAGTTKYLQVVWGCDSGIPQNLVNNKGVNILVSVSPSHTNPVALHAQPIRGSLYVFLGPVDPTITSVKWYIDQTDLVVSTTSTAPFDLFTSRAWDTTTFADGTHRVMALMTYSDGTTGSVDATVFIQNAAPAVATQANADNSQTFIDSATVTEVKPLVSPAVPWSLFAVAIVVAGILLVVIVYKAKVASG